MVPNSSASESTEKMSAQIGYFNTRNLTTETKTISKVNPLALKNLFVCPAFFSFSKCRFPRLSRPHPHPPHPCSLHTCLAAKCSLQQHTPEPTLAPLLSLSPTRGMRGGEQTGPLFSDNHHIASMPAPLLLALNCVARSNSLPHLPLYLSQAHRQSNTR